MAENNGGYKAVNFGYTDDRVYSKLTSDNPIDLVRYQLANCYMGRAGLINSGGAAGGKTDLADAVRTAVINKRAGGMGLILGRKAFKKSMADGVKLINAVQDVYLDGKVTVHKAKIRASPPGLRIVCTRCGLLRLCRVGGKRFRMLIAGKAAVQRGLTGTGRRPEYIRRYRLLPRR